MVENTLLCDKTWAQVLCMLIMCYLIYNYFNNVLDHDDYALI